MASNLVQRVGFAAVAIPLALGVVWLGGLPLALLVAVVAVLGTRELFDFARHQGVEAAAIPGLLSAAAVPIVVWLRFESALLAAWLAEAWPYLVALWILLVLTWVLASRSAGERPLTAAAVTLLGPAYCAVLPAFLLAIRHADHAGRSWPGAVLVFFPLVVVWICDSAAMFVGKAVGGPKLAPEISPGKTRSGAIGGLLGAVAAAALWNQLVMVPFEVAIPLVQALVFGAVIGVVGQVGDLAESLFKREAGVKDSSTLIPGHGGVLDRFDSLYFVLPVAALMLRCFGAA